ncbi:MULTISPECIES: hypothetical protein [Thermococcus]|nr:MULTISPECIES: hypothetical protein [Thermococcus]NJE76182.1 hypothetical protein [Thermococcus sp. ES12]
MVRRKIERVTGESKTSSLLLLIGGLLTSLGFSLGVLNGRNMSQAMLTLILIGPAMIGYALYDMGFKGVSVRLLLQSVALMLSLLGAGHYSTVTVDIAYVGPFLAVLLLMNAQIMVTEGNRRRLLVAASWMIVIFSWTRYWLDDTSGLVKALIVAPYFLSVLMWVAVLVSMYISVSPDYLPIPRSGQEGL